MRHNTKDETIRRNFLQKFRFLIKEYELIKKKKHPRYKFVQDFYKEHGTDRRSFLKYYNRFKQTGKAEDLLPQKRGPKYKTRKPIRFIENKVIELRNLGNNKYEISNMLKPTLKQFTPSPSGVYNIFKRYKLNKLNPTMKKEKKKIIKTKAGALGHIDCHYLPKGIIKDQNKRLYLVGIIDSCTRVAWAEVVEDLKSITVMFATLRSLNILSSEYQIKFKEVLTDNGSEFGGKKIKYKEHHPFEKMLIELDIKHRYTRPYRPQTNGKIERFWRTIEEDLLSETCFDSIEELKDELLQYMAYYNHERPHQALDGQTPAQINEICPRIT